MTLGATAAPSNNETSNNMVAWPCGWEFRMMFETRRHGHTSRGHWYL